MSARLAASFFKRDSKTVARALLGQRLVRLVDGRRLSGLIVEVEAYLGVPDRAAHTFGGRRTQRNESMWAEGGHAYIYFTYGMHHCMNVVAGKEGEPIAALIRALEPVEGQEQMHVTRSTRTAKRLVDTDLCSGPAKLCQAMQIDRDLDGINLVTSEALFLERVRARSYQTSQIMVTPRIGVAYAGEWAAKPLRYYIKGNPHVSRP